MAWNDPCMHSREFTQNALEIYCVQLQVSSWCDTSVILAQIPLFLRIAKHSQHIHRYLAYCCESHAMHVNSKEGFFLMKALAEWKELLRAARVTHVDPGLPSKKFLKLIAPSQDVKQAYSRSYARAMPHSMNTYIASEKRKRTGVPAAKRQGMLEVVEGMSKLCTISMPTARRSVCAHRGHTIHSCFFCSPCLVHWCSVLLYAAGPCSTLFQPCSYCADYVFCSDMYLYSLFRAWSPQSCEYRLRWAATLLTITTKHCYWLVP